MTTATIPGACPMPKCRKLKVEKCGATHCTGDTQIAMFKKAFGENYVPMGTGRVIEVPVF